MQLGHRIWSKLCCLLMYTTRLFESPGFEDHDWLKNDDVAALKWLQFRIGSHSEFSTWLNFDMPGKKQYYGTASVSEIARQTVNLEQAEFSSEQFNKS